MVARVHMYLEYPKFPRGLDYILSLVWYQTHSHLVSEPSPMIENPIQGAWLRIIHIFSLVITIPQAINRATSTFQNWLGRVRL
jgi:hypothetical protein